MRKIKLYTCASGIRLLKNGNTCVAYSLKDDEVENGDFAFLINSDDVTEREFSVFKVDDVKSIEIL